MALAAGERPGHGAFAAGPRQEEVCRKSGKQPKGGRNRYTKKAEAHCTSAFLVGVSGLEPEKTGPESVVLPITPYPKLNGCNQDALSNTGAKLRFSGITTKLLQHFFDPQTEFLPFTVRVKRRNGAVGGVTLPHLHRRGHGRRATGKQVAGTAPGLH